MRFWIAALLLALGCRKSEPLFERIYALDEIPRFEIDLDPAARASLEKDPREWVRGTLRYGSEELRDIGVRLKGHRSLRKLGDKASFKLELDRFVDQKLAKQKTITLNNMVEDPSLMREVLAYRLYRALGVAAPQAGFAEVVLDGESQGLYAVIESIDKLFLRKRFADPDGPIYEGEYGCDVIPEDVEGFDRDGGPKDRDALARFAKLASGPADVLFGPASPLDVPAFLRFLAVEMYVGNFDGYRHGHNYRIYFEPTVGRWYFMPWGLDRTFVKDLSIFDSHGYLARRCFDDAKCRVQFVRVMREVVAEAKRLRLEAGVDVIGVVTKDAVARDPKRSDSVKRKRAELRQYLIDRPAEVERQMTCLDASGSEVDRDGDGHGCRDCNDADPAIKPGATETCDRVDNDCDGLVDDAPACGCTELAASGATFAVCELAMPYADAEAFCASRGEALAWFDSAEQAGAIRGALAPRVANDRKNERWWIGFDDRRKEGTFHSTGSTSYTAWARGEPDNAACNQDCVAMRADEGAWHDTHCLEPRPFVCRAKR